MAAVPTPVSPFAEHRYHRHAGVVRVSHWINVVCFTLLLMSGLQIFNAHPALYVGDRSNFDHPTVSILARQSERLASMVLFSRYDLIGDPSRVPNGS